KAHGARNDFLLTWRNQIPANAGDSPEIAQAICHRHIGVGADGWIILDPADDAAGAIELWNSDGSRSEISGNGTRCAAALLMKEGRTAGSDLRIATGAGPKNLRILEQSGNVFSFEMN